MCIKVIVKMVWLLTSELTEAATVGALQKKVFLKLLQKFAGKHLCQSLRGSRAEHLWATASELTRLFRKNPVENSEKSFNSKTLEKYVFRLSLSLRFIFQNFV